MLGRTFYSNLKALFLVASVATLSNCSSAPTPDVPEGLPAWARQASRTVDAGYIVYVGTGEDYAPERARFKAEAAAIEDLANECSFVPKGARTEDRYDQKIGTLHRAYAKVGISFQDCEEAKSSNDPESIRKLASVQYTEELKRYQNMVDHPQDESDESEDSETAVAQNGTTTNNSGVNVAIYDRYPPPAVIYGTGQFYVVRQQVVYVKQDVILSPPAAYPPQAPQTVAITQHLNTVSSQVHNYEVAHPQLRNSTQSYSTYKQQVHQQRFNQRLNRGNNRGQNQSGRHNSQTQPRRRRRRNEGQ
jgi:hypothetical protein